MAILGAVARASAPLGAAVAAVAATLVVVAPSGVSPAMAPIAFPGDPGKIAYTRDGDIWTINADGSGAAQLTTDPATDSQPEFSPDGRRIVFASNRGGSGIGCWVMDADGTDQQQVLPSCFTPEWSPDGTKIVYRSFVDQDIHVADADGSDDVDLQTGEGPELNPTWSPDGSRIAFEATRPSESDSDIYAVDADGSDLTQLTANDVRDVFPDWSPDGALLLFTRFPPTSTSSGSDLWTMAPDGSGAQAVTDTPADTEETPAWSPDGASIVFASSAAGSLVVADADGSNRSSLGVRGFVPDWQAVPPPGPPVDPAVRVGGAGLNDEQMWIGNGYGAPFRAQGGVLTAGPAVTAVRAGDGSMVPIEIVTGTDHALYVRRDNGSDRWRRLSNDATFCVGAPGAAVYLSGDTQRLVVGCRGSDDALWYATAPVAADQIPVVNRWRSLGGRLEAGPAVGLVHGKMTFAVSGIGGRVWLNDTLQAGNAAYRSTPWTCIGRPAVGSKPQAALDTTTGTAYFGCHGTDDALWVARNVAGVWDTAFSRGGVLREGVGAAVSSEQAVFFVRGTDDAVYQTTVYNGNFEPTPFSANRPSAVRYDPGATALS